MNFHPSFSRGRDSDHGEGQFQGVGILDLSPVKSTFLHSIVSGQGYRVKHLQWVPGALGNDPGTDCLVVRAPMLSDEVIRLLQSAKAEGLEVPIVLIAQSAPVRNIVRALVEGAADYLEEPFTESDLLDSVARVCRLGRENRKSRAAARAAMGLLAKLSARERDVLVEVVKGHSSKVAAHALGISPRTIELHRRRISQKLKVRSLAGLIHIAFFDASLRSQLHPAT